jgi:hypothetical protein
MMDLGVEESSCHLFEDRNPEFVWRVKKIKENLF